MIPTIRKPPHRSHKHNAVTVSRPASFTLNSHQLHLDTEHRLCQLLQTPAILVPHPNPSQINSQKQTSRLTFAGETVISGSRDGQEVSTGGGHGRLEVKNHQKGYLQGIFFEKRGRLIERSYLMRNRIEDSESEDECEFGPIEGRIASMLTVDEEQEKENFNYYENTQEPMERKKASMVHFSIHLNSERQERNSKGTNWELWSEN